MGTKGSKLCQFLFFTFALIKIKKMVNMVIKMSYLFIWFGVSFETL